MGLKKFSGSGLVAPAAAGSASVHAYQYTTAATQTVSGSVAFTRQDFPAGWGMSRTFTPTSSVVQVTLSGYASVSTGELSWVIHNETTAAELTPIRVLRADTVRRRVTVNFLCNATANSSQTWKWRFYTTVDGDVSHEVGASMPMVMILRST